MADSKFEGKSGSKGPETVPKTLIVDDKQENLLARALLENALDAVIGMDQDQTIIDWNRQAEITFGWSKNEVLGRTLAEIIIPAEYRQAHQRGIKHFLATKHGPILNRRVELIALRRSGEVFPIELTVIPINVENRYLFYSFVRDISQRKKTEVLVQQSKEELNQARLNAEHLVDERTQELKRELEERKKAWRRKTSGACKGI